MKNSFLAVTAIALLVFLSGCTNGILECPTDTKTCPDGTVVGRNVRDYCNFFACGEPIGCTDDAKICPGGTGVGRDPNNNCEFFPCPPSEIPSDFMVTLERQGCFGFCPIYEISVNAIGVVTYDGERFVKVEGKKTAIIDAGKVKQLYEKIREMDYFSLSNEYTQNATFDAGSAVTKVTLNGTTKEILHAFEDQSAPEPLTELEDLIDELTNSEQWVGAEETETQWLSYSPIQCGGNPWEIWHDSLGREYIREPTEEEILTEYFEVVHGIEILEYKNIPIEPGTGVCAACTCPRGDTIEVLVGENDAGKMAELGWAELQPEIGDLETECLESGGAWKEHCGLLGNCCNYRTTDAGNACTDSSQCEGSCIAEEISDTEGQCSEWKTQFGCYNIFYDGKVAAVCFD